MEFTTLIPEPGLGDGNATTLKLAALRDLELEERERLEYQLDIRNAALNSMASHFLILDATHPDWPLLYVNQALARDYGYTAQELIGRSPTILIACDERPTQLDRIRQALNEGREIRTELRSRRRDGSTFHSGIFMGPVRDRNGRLTHYVVLGADITARLREEETKRDLQERLYNEMRERERMAINLRVAQKLEAIGQLAAGIAHEINTPTQYVGDSVYFLQTAVADLETLLSAYRDAIRNLPPGESNDAIRARLAELEQQCGVDFLREEVPKAFARTLDGVARVAAIVKAMKEFAHPSHNEQSPADINHAIETTLVVSQNEYKYSATIETQLGELPEVVCNIGEINQVLLNLIINAVHAIDAAGKDQEIGRIRISTAARGGMACITIEDNGCGIPPENLDRIFDPFFTTKEVGKGTGQGLSIAQSIIVEKHGGTIDVESTVGVGTRFVLKLPLNGRPAAGERVR